MSETAHLKLPYIIAAQSQKHVTHNEALRRIDGIVQLSVLDRDLPAPPATPSEGDRYIIAASATGDWAGHDADIALFVDGAWVIVEAREGFLAWVADEDRIVVFDGAAWVDLDGGGSSVAVNPATGGLVGVNTTADTTNRLAVASAASLFSHAGTGGHQQKINKAAAGDTASQLYQTGFSGRAEIGTTGDDDFHFKVSPDGTAWHEAIIIDKDTGEVTFPNSSIGGGGSTPTDIVMMTASGTWTKPPGLVRARVMVLGGGGAGGGAAATGSATASPGGGGGPGGIAFAVIEAADLGATETVTIGAGGVGVSNANGGDGGTTTFTRTTGDDLVATGGLGGFKINAGSTFAFADGGASGAATGGDVNFAGSPSGFAMRDSFPQGISGSGGSTPYGAGGPNIRGGTVSSAGVAATGFGAGGGGALSCGSGGANRAGGNGAPGLVVIEEFF
ncbi:MAG: DUF2793 domain-containing protein [Hyphomicrobiaceae bacterium]|nr:DUF2793 domain-containing protein [Hyphomicrobiaceae bacterium]